ncbi:MAG: DUF1653 domain-containing protein [Gammaproteobacteria bacterium]|nr:DUF1653 domain-containing protein [Gammaproteobacteria bacterium]MCF6230808.1 DUF1653 domain-containing protein [Gammaproteobacteria bacterium]
MPKVKPGRYLHYKGKPYQVIDIATHSETLEPMVVYRPLHGEGKLWVRPLYLFIEPVEVEGEKIDRFEYMGEGDASEQPVATGTA